MLQISVLILGIGLIANAMTGIVQAKSIRLLNERISRLERSRF